MNKCLNCKTEYKPIRATSKYCSDVCRVTHSRVSVTDNSGVSVTNTPEDSVTRDSVTAPRTYANGGLEIGKCHACNKSVADYICICQDCFKRGATHKGLAMCSEPL